MSTSAPPPRRSRRPLFTLLLLAALVVLSSAAASAAAWFLLDPARLKSELGARLGRTVDFADASPGLFRIGVSKLVVGDTAGFDPDPLLACDELSLKYDLFSLLRGRLLVNELSLEAARIGVEFDSAGASNVADLVAPREGGPTFDLQVLRFSNSTILVKRPGQELLVERLEGSLANLASRPYSVDLSCVAAGAPASLTGTVDPESATARMKVKVEKLPLELLPVPPGIIDAAGLALTIDALVGASPDSGSFDGTLDIPGLARVTGDVAVDWTGVPSAFGTLRARADAANLRRIHAVRAALDELKAAGGLEVAVRLDGPLENPPESATGEFLGFQIQPPGFTAPLSNLRGNFAASPRSIRLENVTLTALGENLAVSGGVALPGKELDLSISGRSVNLGTLSRLLEPSPLPSTLSLSGPATFELALKGPSSAPAASGTIRLENVTAVSADPNVKLDALKGQLDLAPGSVRLGGVTALLGGSPLAADGTVSLAEKKLDVTLKAERLDLATLPAALGSHSLDVSGAATFEGRLRGAISNPQVVGAFSSPAMKVYGVPVEALASNLAYDGEKISLSGFEAKVFGGTLSGEASATLAGDRLPFSLSLRGDALALLDVLRAATGSEKITGDLGGSLTLSGEGTNTSTYAGGGNLRSQNISCAGLPLAAQVAPFLGIAPERLQSFQDVNHSFTIAGGRLVLSRPLVYANRHISLKFTGGLGLNGSLDGLNCVAGIPTSALPSRIGNSPLAAILGLKREGERTLVPFKLNGSFSAPGFSLDVRPENVVNELLQRGLGIELPTGGTAPAEAGSPAADEDKTKPGATPSTGNAAETPASETPAAAPRRAPGQEVFEIIGSIFKNR